MKIPILFAAALISTAAAPAGAQVLKPDLQGLGFLVGQWTTSAPGKVPETGGYSTGETTFTPEVSGAVLLRRDHVHLYRSDGSPNGAFDIMMMIYAEEGRLHADYADGDHVIHYTSADVDPGRSATFTSSPSASAPTFRLAYVMSRPEILDIVFTMAPPGSATFRPIATGSVIRLP